MTAIGGIIRLDGRPVDVATLDRMLHVLEPYGRDAQHRLQRGRAGLLRTLLRTTPEDSLDRQPLVDRESGRAMVFDGRVDNREELARELGLDLAETRLLADSALVFQAWRQWGTDTVVRILGDFALACWEPAQRRLVLARDYIGTRPLFWYQGPEFFAFGSLPKALFAIPGVPRELCEEALHDLLCLIPLDGPTSFYKDVYRVLPGHMLLVEDGHVRSVRYHEFDPDHELKLGSDQEYVDGLVERIDTAVARRLRAVGPIASELSSGFDSSTVTAFAARQLAERNANLIAYTAVPREGFADKVMSGFHADEGPGARALAEQFSNVEHIMIRGHPGTFMDALHEYIEILDRAPLNPVNGLWLKAIRDDAASRGVRVLLNGNRGNASISYDGRSYLPTLLRSGRLLQWFAEIRALQQRYPHASWRWALRTSFIPLLPQRMWAMLQRWRGRSVRMHEYSAIDQEFMRRLDTQTRARRAGVDLTYRNWADGRRHRIYALGLVDPGEYSIGMNVGGIESRDPTSDRQLVEYCLAVPESQYLRGGQTKWLLRRAVAHVLPPEILDCPTAGLQGADWYEAAGSELRHFSEELELMARHPSVPGYLELDTMRRALEQWPETGWHRPGTDRTYALKLMRGMAAGAFVRYVENDNRRN